MNTLAGMLLPQSVLSSNWFAVLAAVVGFNTLVYVGLSLSKLVPLPKPVPPSRLRSLLTQAGLDSEGDNPMDLVPEQPSDDGSPYERLRGSVAKNDIPQAFSIAGGFVLLMAVTTLLALEPTVASFLLQLLLGLAMLLLGQLLGRGRYEARTLMRLWVLVCWLLVCLAVFDAATLGNQTPLTYSLIVVVGYAPVTLAWRPALLGAGAMWLTMLFASLYVVGDEDWRIIIATSLGLMVGLILLHLRLTALDRISDEQARSEAIASTDVVTGTLTRNGLQSLMPALGSLASRASQDVCVVVVEVDRLGDAVHDYGHGYARRLLRAVGDAIVGNMRTGDLVSHWGGGHFVIAGMGAGPDPEMLADRIEATVNGSGVTMGKWPMTVSVGRVAGDPSVTTFEALVSEADGQVRGGSGISSG
ncbi:MAG: diguanylate cyclase [Actinobacteria bacterium]|nr:diguanylate cyclase [Actinomycetota bacterium]